MTIVKPSNVHSDIYISFANAFKKTPARAATSVKTDCESQPIAIEKTRIDQGRCADPSNPEQAIKIRYVWLDSISASFLLSGKPIGALADSVGAKPYVSRNKVTEELRNIIKRFGVVSAARKTLEFHQTAPSASLENIRAGFSIFYGADNNTRIYNLPNDVVMPEIALYQELLNGGDFPPEYSFYYHQPRETLDDQQIMQGTIPWRYLSPADLRHYRENTRRVWDLARRSKIPSTLLEVVSWYSLEKDRPENVRPEIPKEIEAMQYFTRDGWPEKFLIALSNEDAACPTAGAFTVILVPRELFVQVAVIEAANGKDSLSIASLKGGEIDSTRLRLPDQDGDWKALELGFPPRNLAPGESLVVPLRLELRTQRDRLFWADWEEAKSFYQEVQNYKGKVITFRNEGRILCKKKKTAFKPPTKPEVEYAYAYGPRIRLESVLLNGHEIKLRQFDPTNVWTHFGFTEGSCPILYVHDSKDGSDPVSYGKILQGAAGKRRERTETIWHEGSAFRLEVREEEPEIAVLNNVRVYVEDEAGEKLIHEETGRVIVPGYPLIIDKSSLHQAKRIRLEVTGYYRSMAEIVAGK
jgi:hypothetical protein